MSAGTVPATFEVAAPLQVEEGVPVVQRRRRYLDDGGVIAVSTSGLPGGLGAGACCRVRGRVGARAAAVRPGGWRAAAARGGQLVAGRGVGDFRAGRGRRAR
ncbi:UTRA domain-containing protein [Streptacidiphilus sp. P02-A3a]|uniref:UTRA domain-containing protein n=1 Tax=Streptacidiphilus sp. P02-A3a TaxID=2704468 RepID=UPI001CDC73A0|nr:UTRA domain-containing protein [Streptacidiphilus sp. P02-A3a]